MIRGLLGKELRQHGFALGFLLLLPFAGQVLIATNGVLRRVGGGFDALRFLLYTFIPLACLVLGQLLIASEFRQKTQLFLEGLPLPRWRMLAVKFGLGLVLALLASALALSYVGWSARHSESMNPRFAALLVAKTAGWTAFTFALCFTHAFLGRYRFLFGVALVVGFAYCQTMDLPIMDFGPFALVDARFAYERFVWPVKALCVTGGLIVALTGLGFILGLMRDATVAALLAEKMSSREKLFLTLLTLIALMAGGESADRRKNAAPVEMPGASEARHGVVHVLASAAVDAPSREETAKLQRTANEVAAELGVLAEYLGCDSFPTVFVVHRRDLQPGEFVDGELKAQQGVLVKANLTDPGFKIEALDGWLLHRTLRAHTHFIATRERNVWVLDGLEWWWPRSRHGELSAWAEAAGAVHALTPPPELTATQLHTWLTVRATLGPENAKVLAGSTLALLAERHGIANLRRFLADRYGQGQPADTRAWWRDVIRPTAARLRAATGLNEQAFAAEWRTAMLSSP